MPLFDVLEEGNYQVMTQGRGIIHISQVSLGLLDSLHAAVDGPHQGLLGQALLTQIRNK